MAAGESGEGGRARLRLARFLAAGPAELCACAQEGRLLLQPAGRARRRLRETRSRQWPGTG